MRGDGGTGAGAGPQGAVRTPAAVYVGELPLAGERGADIREALRSFVAAHPRGWNHDDWLALLDSLRGRGHDVGDADAVGAALERERLAAVLARVRGVGRRRIAAVVERYGSIHALRDAGVDELAAVAGVRGAVAERIRRAE